jgi:hypothetical protein
MPDQYVTMLTALSSAVAGGAVALLSVFLTNRSNTARLKMQLDHESRQRKTELLRSRGEELYELTDKWLNKLAGYYLRRSFVMQGKLTYNQCLDLDIQDGKEESVNFGRIGMLIDVYLPATRPAYDKLIAGRTELNNVAAAHKRAYKSGDADVVRFLTQYVQCQHSIEQAGDVFKTQALESIRAV